MNNFVLNPILENDSLFLKSLELCDLRLLKDGDLDWFLLIPRRVNIKEIYELDACDQSLLIKEIDLISKLLAKHRNIDKINVAALGNMVPQLHIHIIARYVDDRAWPQPVWGSKNIKKFSEDSFDFWKNII
ncbi:MAG: HIT family protein [Bacteriovoracaceae bacterium]|jgi:diadenosine tetraphosphate (Ap4A) HIT family hydrolase|nr:HIT family protein [Bacteriovoracaceae bacterium]